MTSPPAPERTGPWTFRVCITAACTRCGTGPLDEDTGMTPHFDSTAQAGEELARDWGWRITTRPGWADDELLCPACAAAPASAESPAPAPGADGGPETGTAPWWQTPGQPPPALPPNAAVPPSSATWEGG
jgi:hypothetical protein